METILDFVKDNQLLSGLGTSLITATLGGIAWFFRRNGAKHLPAGQPHHQSTTASQSFNGPTVIHGDVVQQLTQSPPTAQPESDPIPDQPRQPATPEQDQSPPAPPKAVTPSSTDEDAHAPSATTPRGARPFDVEHVVIQLREPDNSLARVAMATGVIRHPDGEIRFNLSMSGSLAGMLGLERFGDGRPQCDAVKDLYRSFLATEAAQLPERDGQTSIEHMFDVDEAPRLRRVLQDWPPCDSRGRRRPTLIVRTEDYMKPEEFAILRGGSVELTPEEHEQLRSCTEAFHVQGQKPGRQFRPPQKATFVRSLLTRHGYVAEHSGGLYALLQRVDPTDPDFE